MFLERVDHKYLGMKKSSLKNCSFCTLGELFLSFVTSKRAHARIVSIETTEALALSGVHGYVGHSDVPGSNRWGPLVEDEELFASKVG